MAKVTIQDRLMLLSPYSPGVDLYGGKIVVHLSYKEGWKILKSTTEDVQVGKDDTNPYVYYYYAPLTVDFNVLFDEIDRTIRFNTEAEIKKKLLIEKIKELETIFKEESLETLHTLSFKYRKKKQKPAPEKDKEEPETKEEKEEEKVEPENKEEKE